MKSMILTLLLIVLFVPAINAKPQDLNNMGVKGMELVFDMQYDEANKIFDEMIRMEPENSIGYLLKSKTYFWKYAFGDNKKEYVEKFVDLSFKTIDLSKKMLSNNKEDVDALHNLGTAYLFLGRWYGEDGGMIKAFWYGRKGTKYLKKAIKKDPEYYDAYFGLGVYHYYADVLPKFIKALSFFLGGLGGDSEKGIEEVTLASLKGNFTKGEAKFTLAQIVHFDFENNFEAASRQFENLVAEYPNNHSIKLLLALCYRYLSKYDLAVQTIKKSLQTESLDKFPNIQTQLYRYLGNTYSDMNEHDKAIQSFKTALTLLEAQKRTKSWEYEGALYFIGDCYEMIGDIDKAHAYYLKVSKEDKTGAYTGAQARIKNPLTLSQINVTKGSNYLKYGDYIQAAAIFNDLMAAELNKNPPNKAFVADLNFNIGKLEYETKEYQKSIQTFRKVLASNDIDKEWVKPWSHYYLGKSYKDTGEFEKAKKEFDIAYKHEGNALRQAVDKARGEME